MVWCLLSGNAAVPPMRELVCRVTGLETPFKLVVPPNQKFPSSDTQAMEGAMVATSLVVWPAAPLFLLMHGKDITIPKGTNISAFIQGDVTLDESKFQRQL